jgi:hypothetical protein
MSTYRGHGPRGPNPSMRRKPTAKQRAGVHRLLLGIRARNTARRAP